MNQNTNKDGLKSTLTHQRRTFSVDEYSLQNSNDDYDGKNNIHSKGSSKDRQHDIIKQCSDDTYVCAPLSRMNNRSSALTCWRNRSVFAPSPKCNFGPKGTLKKVQNNAQLIVMQDPSSQRLHWLSPPNNILIVRKPGPSTLPEFRTIVEKLLKRRLCVYIDPSDRKYLLSFDTDTTIQKHIARCIAIDEEKDLSKIDLIICLGGDGTLLHVSSIFQKSCPPVLAFSMGSLGFLTPFDFNFHEKILNDVLSGDVPVLLRTRLTCQIIKDGSNEKEISSETNNNILVNNTNNNNNNNNNDDDDIVSLSLNEVVIDRGPNSYLSNLDLYINDRFITKVQGDGLVISTPTGSTAYAMAAGASMVHPNVPAIVICPICPHSLSFRPIVVPAGIELTVKVSEDTRLTAWLSVDGRNRHELKQGNCIKITTSVYPVPSISRFDQLGDWFESLADILHWNLRKPQLSLEIEKEDQRDEQQQTRGNINTIEEDPNSSTSSASDSMVDVHL